MSFIQRALLSRMGVGSRLANAFILVRVAISIARRLGLISDDRIDKMGLERAGITKSLSVPELAMAGWIIWRFFYRRTAESRKEQ